MASISSLCPTNGCLALPDLAACGLVHREVEMTVGHSFRFRDGLSILQAEDVESAQAVLDAEREYLINDCA